MTAAGKPVTATGQAVYPLDVLARRGEPLPHGDASGAFQPASDSAAAPEIVAVHDRIPGRVRWRVPGLRGNTVLKTTLEIGLPELPGLHMAQASVETGNLLTLFDPALATAPV